MRDAQLTVAHGDGRGVLEHRAEQRLLAHDLGHHPLPGLAELAGRRRGRRGGRGLPAGARRRLATAAARACCAAARGAPRRRRAAGRAGGGGGAPRLGARRACRAARRSRRLSWTRAGRAAAAGAALLRAAGARPPRRLAMSVLERLRARGGAWRAPRRSRARRADAATRASPRRHRGTRAACRGARRARTASAERPQLAAPRRASGRPAWRPAPPSARARRRSSSMTSRLKPSRSSPSRAARSIASSAARAVAPEQGRREGAHLAPAPWRPAARPRWSRLQPSLAVGDGGVEQRQRVAQLPSAPRTISAAAPAASNGTFSLSRMALELARSAIRGAIGRKSKRWQRESTVAGMSLRVGGRQDEDDVRRRLLQRLEEAR